MKNKLFFISFIFSNLIFSQSKVGKYNVEAYYSDTNTKYNLVHFRSLMVSDIGINALIFGLNKSGFMDSYGNHLINIPFNKTIPKVDANFTSRIEHFNVSNINNPKMNSDEMFVTNFENILKLTNFKLSKNTNQSSIENLSISNSFELNNEKGDIETFSIFSTYNGNRICGFLAKEKLSLKPYLFIYDYFNNSKYRKIDLFNVDPNFHNVKGSYTLCYKKNNDFYYARFIKISGVVQNENYIYIFLEDNIKGIVMPVIINKLNNKITFKKDIEINLKLYDISTKDFGIYDDMSFYNEGYYYLSTSKGFATFSNQLSSEKSKIIIYDKNFQVLNSLQLNDICVTRINDLGNFVIITGYTKKSGYIGYSNPKIIIYDKIKKIICNSSVIKKKDSSINTLNIDENDNIIISIGHDSYSRRFDTEYIPQVIIDRLNKDGKFENNLFND